ncbi:hypothetical protein TNCT_417321 [Trichonephila clavata]|uniref:Uncharacterized protein n=1 Tax=Trichonephila clavata TaxID=2740835 RepID=A0A8X6LIL0_TRICU|nr:hypothetical protein TNCT_417321 [Trichonephila clavata]
MSITAPRQRNRRHFHNAIRAQPTGFSDPYYPPCPAYRFLHKHDVMCASKGGSAHPIPVICARLPELKVAVGCRSLFQGRIRRFRGRAVQSV